jgi:hypothetical protein
VVSLLTAGSKIVEERRVLTMEEMQIATNGDEKAMAFEYHFVPLSP